MDLDSDLDVDSMEEVECSLEEIQAVSLEEDVVDY